MGRQLHMGGRIRLISVALGMGPADLAERLAETTDLDRAALSQIEMGTRQLTPHELEETARVFGVDPVALLGRRDWSPILALGGREWERPGA